MAKLGAKSQKTGKLNQQKCKIMIWMEWSQNRIDYEHVRAGFISIGQELILPPRPDSSNFDSFRFYTKINRSLKASKSTVLQPLKRHRGTLFLIYTLLLTEDFGFVVDAHQAWADVQMTFYVIEAVFDHSQGSALRGKIDRFLTGKNHSSVNTPSTVIDQKHEMEQDNQHKDDLGKHKKANSEHSNDPSFEVNLGATCEDLNEAGDNDKNINDEDRVDGTARRY